MSDSKSDTATCPTCGTPNGWHTGECEVIPKEDRAEVRAMMLRYGAIVASWRRVAAVAETAHRLHADKQLSDAGLADILDAPNADRSGWTIEQHIQWLREMEMSETAAAMERMRAALKRIAAVQYGLDMSDPTQDREAYWHEMATAYRKTASEALTRDARHQ